MIKGNGKSLNGTWAQRLIKPLGILVIFATLAMGFAVAQSEKPPGYLGPPTPLDKPSGPSSPEPPGPLSPGQPLLLPNIRINDKIADLPDQSQSETTVAVDPTDPRRLVAGFNDCRGFDIASRGGISGWGYSVDGGQTWTGVQTSLPKASPADFGTRGDPSIDVDADGNFYYASLYQRSGASALNVSVHKGRFSGDTITWQPPTFATNFTSGFGTDKEHIGVDRRNGYLYVSYSNFNGPPQIEVVRSTNGGQAWSAPVIIAPGGPVVHQGSLPRVGPDGEVYVVWEDGYTQPTRSIHIRKSTNWPNFGPDVTVSSVTPVSNPPFNHRINEFPTMAVDTTNGPNRGRVYVAWNDGRFGGGGNFGTIILTHSPDGSAGSWSTPIRLDDDTDPPSMTQTHRWFPWMAIDARGTVNIAWYDRRLRGTNPAMTDAFGTQYRAGGSVARNFRITDRSYSMNVPSRCTPNFGDYNGAAVGPSRFHFVYGDGREGNPDTYAGGIIVSPILSEPASPAEVCRSMPASTTITVLGGPGLYQDDVTLDLIDVYPPTTTITATFNPNPVPRPSAAGATSRMTINTTAATPADGYVLYVLGSDGQLEELTEVNLLVRAQAPGAPNLIRPASGEENLVNTPTFAWSEADGASKYRLQIFDGGSCAGTPVRDLDNLTTTEATLSSAQALNVYQTYSWKVIARNACGDTASSQCFQFVTQSCNTAPLEAFANGGFEQGVTGWTIDAAVPAPLITEAQRHTGSKALRLGYIGEIGTPTRRGASEVHGTVMIPETARSPQLSFWFYPQSTDTVFNDQQIVYILPVDPPGSPVVLMTEARNDRTFLNRTYSLDAFRGQTIEIHFRVVNNGNDYPTGMFLDDVSVTFGSCGVPDFFLTATAVNSNEICAPGMRDYTVGVVSLNGPNFTSPVRLRAEGLPPDVSVTFARNPVPPGTTTTMTLRTTDAQKEGRFYFDIIGRAEPGPPDEERAATTDFFSHQAPPEAPELISPQEDEENVSLRATFRWAEPSDLSAEKHYRIQIARDDQFTLLAVDAETTDSSFTVPADALTGGTEYFWRVRGMNACGAGTFSAPRRFVTRD